MSVTAGLKIKVGKKIVVVSSFNKIGVVVRIKSQGMKSVVMVEESSHYGRQ